MFNERKTDWELFYKEAEQYFKLAKGAVNKPEKFSPDTIYNLSSMSIEKYFMAYFIKNKSMPSNHTLTDLLDSMKEIATVDEEIASRLIRMDSFQEICSVENYNRKTPTDSDISFFIDSLNMVSSFISNKLEEEE